MKTPHKPNYSLRGVPRSETQSETPQKEYFSYHTLSDRERRNLTILELIRKKGSISRTELSKISGINIVSITNYIKDYISKDIVLEDGLDVSRGGRKPELVKVNTKGCFVVGVDIGELELIATMADLGINVVKKIKMPRPKMDELAVKSIDLIQELIKEAKIGMDKMKMIGLGVSQGTDIVSTRSAIEKKFNVATLIGSDAACAAFGEKRLNPQADVEDLLYIYSDVGCGIVIKGDIYFGAGGYAGEMQISNFKDAQYLRPWGADLGIICAAKREMEKGIGTKIVSLAKGRTDNVTKELVIEAAKENDEIALDIIQSAGMNLGLRIAYLVNLFNPEIVVIGGGVEKAGELILDPIRKTIKKLSLSKQVDTVRILPSALGEDAVSLGTVSLAIREIFLKA